MSKKTELLILLCGLLVVTLACARASGSLPQSSSGLPVGKTTRTLTHNGLNRSYTLYVPASLNQEQPVPLVFVFHGGTGNAQSAMAMSGFNEVADQNGFMVVYPNGTGRLSDNALLTWNAGACCAYAQQTQVDDVGFVRAIVADLQSRLPLDSKRIYAAGLSNGAMLSHRLGCEAADLFAAIAPVAGTLNVSPCQPSQPISVIEFHGTADRNVPYEGGHGPNSLVDVAFASVPDSIDFWARANGCQSEPQTDSVEESQHQVWPGCAASTAVELYTIMGGGHSWPGGRSGWPGSDPPTQTLSASRLIWDFFAAHPKP